MAPRDRPYELKDQQDLQLLVDAVFYLFENGGIDAMDTGVHKLLIKELKRVHKIDKDVAEDFRGRIQDEPADSEMGIRLARQLRDMTTYNNIMDDFIGGYQFMLTSRLRMEHDRTREQFILDCLNLSALGLDTDETVAEFCRVYRHKRNNFQQASDMIIAFTTAHEERLRAEQLLAQ